jgi:hypothetical protein
MVYASLTPNLKAANHRRDFDARLFVLGGEITITRDNSPETLRAGQCCEVPANSMHAERARGVAYVSGRRRHGGVLSREAFESDRRRDGLEIVHSGQAAALAEDLHAHDLDVRIMVLGGSLTFHAGGHCEIPADCQRTTKVGSEGIAYTVGKADRRAATGQVRRVAKSPAPRALAVEVLAGTANSA